MEKLVLASRHHKQNNRHENVLQAKLLVEENIDIF